MNKKRELNIHKRIRTYGTYEEGSAWVTPLGEYNIVHYDCRPTDKEIRERVNDAIKEIIDESVEKPDCTLCEIRNHLQ